MPVRPLLTPPLDPGFVPAEVWNRAYRELCAGDPGALPLAIALERTDGTISRFDTRVLPHAGENLALNRKYVERLVKFLLWSRGGWRVLIGGDPAIAEMVRGTYAPGGERAFDHDFMGAKIYGRPLTVESRELFNEVHVDDQIPAEERRKNRPRVVPVHFGDFAT